MYWFISLLGALLVGALLTYLLGRVFGRGEALQPVERNVAEREHVRRWATEPITARSVNEVMFTPSLRGYNQEEVDLYLQRVQERLAELEGRAPFGSPAPGASSP